MSRPPSTALVLSIAVIAMAEVIRGARFLNAGLALLLIVAPWVLTGFSTFSIANDVVAGALLGFASLPRGRVTERYAAWDRYIV